MATNNPISLQRFFVWQQYRDHFGRSHSHSELSAWFDFISVCGADAACTRQRRITTARGFIESGEFRDTVLCQRGGVCTLRDYPPGSYAYNSEYVRQLYLVHLRREPDAGGHGAWLNYINTHPGDYDTLTHGFLYSDEYRRRFEMTDDSLPEVTIYWCWDEPAQLWYGYPPFQSFGSRLVDGWCGDSMCYYEEEVPDGEGMWVGDGKDSGTVTSSAQEGGRRRKKRPPGARGFEVYAVRDASDKLAVGAATR